MEKNKSVALWLFLSAAAVFLMAVIGAVTRLTESGLSIVEWKPIAGALPPLNDADWQQTFALYKTSPQYKMVNLGMSLDDFKHIFFWEWLHRLWGRTIGIIYALPLAYFWLRGKILAAAKKPLLGILALGFLQGAMGWFMVKSGLVDQPAVSHYRLAAHLLLAFIIFCAMFRMGLAFCVTRETKAFPSLRRTVAVVFVLALVTMTWGAFTAGLRAGMVYNDDFPMMGRHLWPDEIAFLKPLWINFVENHAAVQFAHRVLAVSTFAGVIWSAWKSRAAVLPIRTQRVFVALALMACVQVVLGISTVVTHVNIAVATLHQAGAMTLLALFVTLLYLLPAREAAS